MSLNMNFNHISNFDKKKRSKNQIKLIVFHYTGMQSKIEAFKKLCSPKSKVSCHYFIDEIGNIQKLFQKSFRLGTRENRPGKILNFLINFQ